MKARCTRPGFSGVPRPSSVVIFRPPSVETGVTQENTARPSTSTVQAPHWPRPQPNLAPFSSQLVAQHVEQRRVGSASTSRLVAVDIEADHVALLANLLELLVDVGPGGGAAELAADVGGQLRHLLVGQRIGEAGHQRAGFAFGRRDAVAAMMRTRLRGVGIVMAIAERQRQRAGRARPASRVVAGGAGAGVDRGTLTSPLAASAAGRSVRGQRGRHLPCGRSAEPAGRRARRRRPPIARTSASGAAARLRTTGPIGPAAMRVALAEAGAQVGEELLARSTGTGDGRAAR